MSFDHPDFLCHGEMEICAIICHTWNFQEICTSTANLHRRVCPVQHQTNMEGRYRGIGKSESKVGVSGGGTVSEDKELLQLSPIK